MVGLLAFAGCQVDTSVDVVVDDDGSGSVTVTVALDEEAAAQIPDLADQLRVQDLERTGWEVTGPEPAEGGGVTVAATKAFFEPAQAAEVLDEVGIVTGMLERGRSFAETSYDFDGSLDLSAGLATFSDPELTELLGGLPVGQDPSALQEEFGRPVRALTSFHVSVTLPEGDDTRTFEWDARLNDDPVALTAGTEDRNWLALGLAAVAAAAVLVLVLVVFWRLIRRSRRPDRAPGRRWEERRA